MGDWHARLAYGMIRMPYARRACQSPMAMEIPRVLNRPVYNHLHGGQALRSMPDVGF
jgi:hypothetical protein